MHGPSPGSSGAFLMLPSISPACLPSNSHMRPSSEISEGSKDVSVFLSFWTICSISACFQTAQYQSPGFPHGFCWSDVNSSHWQVSSDPSFFASWACQSILRRLEIILTKKHMRDLGQTCQESQHLLGFLFQNMTFAANVSDLSHLCSLEFGLLVQLDHGRLELKVTLRIMYFSISEEETKADKGDMKMSQVI